MLRRRLPALMLHGVTGNCLAPPGISSEEAFYDISEQKFVAVLDMVADSGLNTIVSTQIDDVGAPGDTLISFDDGRASDFALAMPALIDRKMRAVFFVTTDWIGTAGYMTPSQLREMNSLGMDIQVHGKTHRFLTELNHSDLVAELVSAKAALEDVLGNSVTALAYPGGRGDKQIRETAIELGFGSFFCSRPGWYRPGMSEVPRMVVHSTSTLDDLACYLQKKPGPVVRQVARYHAGRVLRMVLGASGYAKLKNLAQGR